MKSQDPLKTSKLDELVAFIVWLAGAITMASTLLSMWLLMLIDNYPSLSLGIASFLGCMFFIFMVVAYGCAIVFTKESTK